jgi:hypothetical protein
MTEDSIIRENLMEDKNYRPYCEVNNQSCYMPRTIWTGEQFLCPNCKWRSDFPKEFIDRYKLKHNL